MIKKIVCAAIMTALLVSQAVCVLADEPARSVATTTTYANGQVAVTTTVSGVETDDEITYLAYTGTDVTDESIAYIDQRTVKDEDDGTVKFEYVADFKFNGSKVMVGGLNKSTSAAFAVDETGKIDAKTTVILSGPTKYLIFYVDPVTEDTGFTKLSEGYDESGNADKAVVDGEKLHLDGEDVTWFAAADGIWVANSALKGQTQVKFGWEGSAPEIASTPVLAKVGNVGKKLVVLAKKANGATEYGIKLSKKAIAEGTVAENESVDVTAAEVSTLDESIVKYAALGTDAEGNYAVVIDGILADNVEFNVAAYSDLVNTKAETITNVVESATPEVTQ